MMGQTATEKVQGDGRFRYVEIASKKEERTNEKKKERTKRNKK